MNDIEIRLKTFSKLINPNTIIKSELVSYNPYTYPHYDENLRFPYFEELWTDEFDKYLIKLISYCGIFWDCYAFELFYSTFKDYETNYCSEKYIGKKSKKISSYFREHPKELFYPEFSKYPKTWKSIIRELPLTPEDISKTFFYDFSDYLINRGCYLIKENQVQVYCHIRKSKATGIEFSDNHSGNSRSYYNRTIKLWDIQNFSIFFSREDLDPFRRIGTEDDVLKSLPKLKELLDVLQYIPNENCNCYEILTNIGVERYQHFYKIAKECFWPVRYSELYGSWFAAVYATGYLGDKPIKKGFYGYKALAKDGHVCNSLAEKIIDDWLFENKIQHEKEPSYPDEVKSFLGKRIRADWLLVDDYYVEYFGLQSNQEYAKKTQLKILACKLFGIKLISLYPGDEFHLAEIFGEFIKDE